MRGVAALGTAALALSAGPSPAAARTAVAPCRGSALSATFSVVPGSAGAGNIVYVLRIRNRTGATCFVSGLPRVVLIGRTGRVLPTHPFPQHPGALTAVQVVLKPGAYASESARFTPDVPGPGESTIGACEPVATRLRVTPKPGGGTVLAPIVPPTRVCVHGRLTLSVFVAGRNGAIP
ncbi:MAG TPA: DUF4232 domain-containing protein [Gaiellaceae bacterium]|jgi:hypothetical protein